MDLNRKKKSSIYTKSAAAVTAFVFVFTSVAPAQLVSQPVLPPFVTPIQLQIPQEFGNIRESFSASEKSPSVFLIQDAHDSLDAQENIRFILKQLVEKEKVSAVCFEGGSQELSRKFYNFTESAPENQKIWDALFHQGEISGLERYALEAPAQTKFFGIEDAKTYFENIHSIQNAFSENDKAQLGIQKKDAELSSRAGRILSGEAKKFRDLKKAFEEKRIDLERYAKELSKWAPEISNPANQREWPQLVRVMKLSEISSKLNSLKIKIPENLKLLSASAKGHLRWQIERLADEGFNFDQTPELKDWIGFQILQDELFAPKLFEEVERLEQQILSRMKISDGARGFLAEEHHWQLTKKLISLQLTRKEWEEAEKLSSDALTQTARRNYKIVEARDKILAEKTLNRIHDLKSKKTALVLGGFHTDKMAAFFKTNNISYTIINPAIKNPDRKLNYRSRISPPDQTAPVVVGASLGIPDAQPFIHHIIAQAASLGVEDPRWWANGSMTSDDLIKAINNRSEKERKKDGHSRFVVIATNIDEALGLLSLGGARRAEIINKNETTSMILLLLLGKLLSRYESRAQFVGMLYGKRLDPFLVGKLSDKETTIYTDAKGREKRHPKPVFNKVSFENIQEALLDIPYMPEVEIQQFQARLVKEIEIALSEHIDLYISQEAIEKTVSNFFEQIRQEDVFNFASKSWLSSDKSYAAVREASKNGNIQYIEGNLWSDGLSSVMHLVNNTPGESVLFLSVSGSERPNWSTKKWQHFLKLNFKNHESAYVVTDSLIPISAYFFSHANGQSLGNEIAVEQTMSKQLIADPEVKLILIRNSWKREIIVLLKPWAISGVFATNEWFETVKHDPVEERKSPTDLEIFRGIIDKWFHVHASSLGNETAVEVAVPQQLRADPEVKSILITKNSWRREIIGLLQPWAVSGVFATNEWFDSVKHNPIEERKTPTDLEIFRAIIDKWFHVRASSLGTQLDDAAQFVGREAGKIKYKIDGDERENLAKRLRIGSLNADGIIRELKERKTEYENRVRLDAGWFVGASLGKKDETDSFKETSTTISKIHSIIHRLWLVERKSAHTDLWIAAYGAGIVSGKPDIKTYLEYLEEKNKSEKYAQTLVHAVKAGIVTKIDSIQYFLRLMFSHDWFEAYAGTALQFMESGILKQAPPELGKAFAELNKKGGQFVFPKIYMKAYRLGILPIPSTFESEAHPDFLIQAYGSGLIKNKPHLNDYFELLEKNKAWKVYSETLFDAIEFGIISDPETAKRHIQKLKERGFSIYSVQAELKAYKAKLFSQKPNLESIYKELETGGLWEIYAEITSLALEAGVYPIHPEALSRIKKISEQFNLPTSLVSASSGMNEDFLRNAARILQSVRDENFAEKDPEWRIDTRIFEDFLSSALPHLITISPDLTQYILDQSLSHTGQLSLLYEVFEEFAFLDAGKIEVLKSFYQKTRKRFADNPDFLLALAGYLNVYPELGFSLADFQKDLGNGEETAGEILKRLGYKVMSSTAVRLGILTNPDDLKEMPGFSKSAWDFRYLGRLISYRALWKEDQKQLFNLLMRATLQGKQETILDPAHYSDEPDNFLGEASQPWIQKIRRHNLNFLKLIEDVGFNVNVWLKPSLAITPVIVGENETEKSYRIRFWDRDFSREMFLGNYANSCVSLGRGSASFFQMFLDLGTQFVVIEDTRGRIKGYARFFLAKDDLGQFKIYIDTISGSVANKYQSEMAAFIDRFADAASDFHAGVLNRSWHISSKVGGALTPNYFQHSLAKIEVPKLDSSIDGWEPRDGWPVIENVSAASLGRKIQVGLTTLQIQQEVASQLRELEKEKWEGQSIVFEGGSTANSIIPGLPGEYWVHFHSRKGPNSEYGNGFLFKIKIENEQITLSDPMGESHMEHGNINLPFGFVPLKNLISKSAQKWLIKKATQTAQFRIEIIKNILDQHQQGSLELKHVLAQAKIPQLKGLWDIIKESEFGPEGEAIEGGFTFKRVDHAAVAASLGRKKNDYDLVVRSKKVNLIELIADGEFEKDPQFKQESFDAFNPPVHPELADKITLPNTPSVYTLQKAEDVFVEYNNRRIGRNIIRELFEQRQFPVVQGNGVTKATLEGLLNSKTLTQAAKILHVDIPLLRGAALKNGAQQIGRDWFISSDWIGKELRRTSRLIPLHLFLEELSKNGFNLSSPYLIDLVSHPKKYLRSDLVDKFFEDRESLLELSAGGKILHGAENIHMISLDTAFQLARILRPLSWDTTGDLAKKVGVGPEYIRRLVMDEFKNPGSGIQSILFSDLIARESQYRILPEESERIVKLFSDKAKSYQKTVGDPSGKQINSWLDLLAILDGQWFTVEQLRKRWNMKTDAAVRHMIVRGELTAVSIETPFAKESFPYVFAKHPQFIALDQQNQKRFQEIVTFVTPYAEKVKSINTLEELEREFKGWYSFERLVTEVGLSADSVRNQFQRKNLPFIKMDLLGWKKGYRFVPPSVGRQWIENYQTSKQKEYVKASSLGSNPLYINRSSKQTLARRLGEIPGIRQKSAEVIADAIVRRRPFLNSQDLAQKLLDPKLDSKKPGTLSESTVQALQLGIEKGLVGFDSLDLNTADRDKLAEAIAKIQGINPAAVSFLTKIILERRPFTSGDIRSKLLLPEIKKLDDSVIQILTNSVENGLPLFDLNAGSEVKLTALLKRLPGIPEAEIPFIVRLIQSRRLFTKRNAAEKFAEPFPFVLDDATLQLFLNSIDDGVFSIVLFDINNAPAKNLGDRLKLIPGIAEASSLKASEMIIKRRPFTRLDIEDRLSIPENGSGSLDAATVKAIVEAVDSGQVLLKKYRGFSKVEIPAVRKDLSNDSFTYVGQPKIKISKDHEIILLVMPNASSADWEVVHERLRKFSDQVKPKAHTGRIPVILFIPALKYFSLESIFTIWKRQGYEEGLRLQKELENPSVLLRDALADPKNAGVKKRLEEDWKEECRKIDLFVQKLDSVTTAETAEKRLAELKKRESSKDSNYGIMPVDNLPLANVIRWGVEFGVVFKTEEKTFDEFIAANDSARIHRFIFLHLSYNDLAGADFYCDLDFRRIAESIYQDNKSTWKYITDIQARPKMRNIGVLLPIVFSQYAGFELETQPDFFKNQKDEKGLYPLYLGMSKEFKGELTPEQRYDYAWAQAIRTVLVDSIDNQYYYGERVNIAKSILERIKSRNLSIKNIVEKWGARFFAKRQADVVFDETKLIPDAHKTLLSLLQEENLIMKNEMEYMFVPGASLGTPDPVLKQFNLHWNTGNFLGSPYGVSERSIRLIGKTTWKIYGEDLRRVDPKLFERILIQEFSSKSLAVQFPEFIKTNEPALVITGPVSPEALLAQISSGKTVVVHYSDPAYKNQFDAQASRAVELGMLTQDQLKKHAYFADISSFAVSESEFYAKLLKGEHVGNLRSLNWIKQQAGLAASDPVVWMAKDSVIDLVSKKDIPGIGLPFVDQYLVDASVKDRILYDIERLALAVKLSHGFEELKSQGLVIFQNGRYSQTDRFLQSFLGNAVLEHQVAKLVASMA